ncbi:Maf family protein [Turneriella parva]|uniref:dTTP/UTP pyrophosphatase n=1 Tax=Turneriella parva (strain ATCC BAA-1111 / DSM 21527 / NCTC 11395 / H) TaxID=869212 RepID=I4BC23_TURPD|nr:Maf family protein [Turneriella parva]AFM14830.1 Septum formation protein Maf [Turneriella parva DSM 21527]
MSNEFASVQIVLASASPRRREILEKLGFRCEVRPANIDELAIRDADAEKQTLRIAHEKARVIAAPGVLTVAADTIVVLDGLVLEKPQDRPEAISMLSRLSGRPHLVHTAVSLVFPRGEKAEIIETTRVFFAELPASVIEAYADTPSPYDKAGGYGVQDAFGMQNIERIEGCYFNVMGFPSSRFMRLLRENRKLLL